MDSPEDLWNRAEQALIRDNMTMREFVATYGIASTILAVAYAVQEGILGIGDALWMTIGAFGAGIRELIGSTFGAGADVIDAGRFTSVWSFTEGTASLLGPFALPAAVAVAILSLWVFLEGWNRLSWNPLAFMGRFRGK